MVIQFFKRGKKISEALEGLSEAAAELGNKEFKKVRRSVEAVDKELHSNPWIYVGAAAAAALLIGFLAGRSSKKEKWDR